MVYVFSQVYVNFLFELVHSIIKRHDFEFYMFYLIVYMNVMSLYILLIHWFFFITFIIVDEMVCKEFFFPLIILTCHIRIIYG